MSSALASTLARCAVRRARPVLVANPLVAAAAALLAVTTPPLAVVAGRRLGAAIGPAVAREDGVAAALVLGLALSAAAAGALTVLAAPGVAVLGSQLRTAPIRPLEALNSVGADRPFFAGPTEIADEVVRRSRAIVDEARVARIGVRVEGTRIDERGPDGKANRT